MSKEFLPDSYTAYKNKIGLNIDGKTLDERKEVSLVWAYKDCVLAGGQDKEDTKRDEIFYNETLWSDQIDRLLDAKVFTEFKRIDKDGKHPLESFRKDENGNIKDNLIIKGNNLLALHSLKKKFKGKVKLIYIDIPYNTGSDGFRYNDRFNHSTWLTFIKGRINIARDLLSKDGIIFVQCDHHEVWYLNVVMDEVFLPENKVQLISIKTSAPAWFKTVNPWPIDVTEYILYYSKSKSNVNFKKAYTPVWYNKNYNLYIENKEASPNEWIFKPIIEAFYEKLNISDNKSAKEKWGEKWKEIRDVLIADFALENATKIVSIRDPHNPTDKIKELMAKSKTLDYVLEHNREDNTSLYLYKGWSLAFYSNKLQNIDWVISPTELLTDFWDDISWAWIANEWGVKLKNGKKPEKLLKRLIEIWTNENDIVLDFFWWSGTTGAVAHKMKRQYILTEQMDYIHDLPEQRLINVINGDKTGISESVWWKWGWDVVYMEIACDAERYIEMIRDAETTDILIEIWAELKTKSFVNYKLDPQNIDNTLEEFKTLPLEEQKRILIETIDKNALYKNLSEIDDMKSGVSEEDKMLNRDFYNS